MIDKQLDYTHIERGMIMSYLDWLFLFQDEYETDFIQAEHIFLDEVCRGQLVAVEPK